MLLLAAVVEVGLLGLFHPQEVLVVRDGVTITVRRAGDELDVQGRRAPVFRALGRFELRLPEKFRRRYQGALSISSRNGELEIVLAADVEYLVAATVTAESPPAAPPAALAAQSIVARSWMLASPRRHGHFDLCDTTHCQHATEPTPAAIRAASATRGLILAWRGRPFAAAHSASCGGRTRTASAIGWTPANTYPYFAVDCPVCQKNEPLWTRRFEEYDAASLREHPHSEATRLAIGRRSGWDALPGNNYELIETGEGLELRGRGQGHGVGYCQRGAAGLARQGRTTAEILRHYFPGTAIISSR
jgi:stage II sporulation protein D